MIIGDQKQIIVKNYQKILYSIYYHYDHHQYHHFSPLATLTQYCTATATIITTTIYQSLTHDNQQLFGISLLLSSLIKTSSLCIHSMIVA